MPHVLTASSTIQCTHGGSASVSPSQSDALADGSPMLTGTLDKKGKARHESVLPKPVKKVVYKPRTPVKEKPYDPLEKLLG